MTAIGNLIRREREARGLTLADLSRATGIAVPNLSRIETGSVDPRWGTITRITDALDTDLTLTPRGQPTTLEALRARNRAGRRILAAVGLDPSDPAQRLGRKAAAGTDVTVEAETLR